MYIIAKITNQPIHAKVENIRYIGKMDSRLVNVQDLSYALFFKTEEAANEEFQRLTEQLRKDKICQRYAIIEVPSNIYLSDIEEYVLNRLKVTYKARNAS